MDNNSGVITQIKSEIETLEQFRHEIFAKWTAAQVNGDDNAPAFLKQAVAITEEIRKKTAELQTLEKAAEDAKAEDAKKAKTTAVASGVDLALQKTLDVLTNIQFYPATECVEINDKDVKRLFSLAQKDYQRILNGDKSYGIIEKKHHKKREKDVGRVITNFTVKNADGYDDTTPLDEFTRAVLGACISEQMAGNRYTTINAIFRQLIGQTGKTGIVPYKNQRDAIYNSLKKLRQTLVDFSDDGFKTLRYTDAKGNELILKEDYLLPCCLMDAKINGQVIEDIIYFTHKSVLFRIADSKNQIVRYPAELLDVPNQRNTPRIIAVKKYVMRRICEIKLHKQLTPTITFDDVFKKCGLTDSFRSIKQDARNIIVNLFEHLKQQNFITNFELVQVRSKFVSVKFSF